MTRFAESLALSRRPAAQSVPPGRARRRKDSGYALLLIFLMASMVAISLYMELPRVAMASERQKEQLLMERGMQYKRAIGLFLRTNKNTRWPATVEELENFNNRRSLRKRYIDPMTGKDEWRLIHIQNGVLIDSITNKKPDSNDTAMQHTGFIAEIPNMAQQNTGTQTVNAGLRRRPSDGGTAVGPDGQPIQGASGGTGSLGGYPGAPPIPGAGQPPGGVLPGVPGGAPSAPPAGPAGIAGLMGIPQSGQPGASGQTNNQSSGGLMGGLSGGGLSGGGLTGSGSASQPTVPGAPPGGFPGNGMNGVPGMAGSVPGNGQPANGQPGGVQINPAAQSAAAGLLQNLLTSPRPGGLQGITAGAGAGGVIMGGGIAGVASKAEGESVMVYGDRSDFSEWEFIYDPMKFHVQNPNSGNGASGAGVPAASLGSNAGLSAPGTAIGTGPGGAQMPGGPGVGPGAGMTSAIGAGATNAAFTTAGPGGAPGAPGAPGGTAPGGAAPPPGGGSAAFGQQGLDTDIRPGKK